MSDASVNPSNESPRQSPPPHIASPTRSLSPLPIPFPHAKIAIDVDTDENYPTTPPDRRPSSQVYAPLSPCSALAVLQAFGTGGDVENLRRVAQITTSLLTTRTAAYEARIATLQAENDQLRTRTAPTPIRHRTSVCPQGFLPNGRRLLHFYVPYNGHRAPARYIRASPGDASSAEGTMGEPGSKVYAFELYATEYPPPSEEDERPPPEPLPEWFRDLCHATFPHYRALLDGSRGLEDWGLTADIARYRTTSERIRDLYAAQEGIEASLTGLRESLDLVAFRLGSARAGERLGRYRNLVDVIPSSQHNNTRRRGRFVDQGRGQPQN
jgi:hypothetical protein